MNSSSVETKDNEELIRALGIKQKHLKRREEQAKKKKKKKNKQLIRERNLEKEVISKARLNCRNKDKEFNETETEKEKEAPWPRVTWKGLGMEPCREVPGRWRDNMVWPAGEIRPPYRNGSEPVIWVGEYDNY